MSALSKDLYLPSLLDRLTNDDANNRQLNDIMQKIKVHESELNGMINLKEELSESAAAEQKEKQQTLRYQLTEMKTQYSMLSASISSKKDVHACVRRDLEWLLNVNQYFPTEELDAYPEVARSVINYGVPDLTGKTLSGMNILQLQKLLRQAIINFEPRIIQNTLTIKPVKDQSKAAHNIFIFEIEGELWSKPAPLHLYLRTEFELENNQVYVYEMQ